LELDQGEKVAKKVALLNSPTVCQKAVLEIAIDIHEIKAQMTFQSSIFQGHPKPMLWAEKKYS
jgi:hypothetical protein